jgi:hypothetical protein
MALAAHARKHDPQPMQVSALMRSFSAVAKSGESQFG